MKKILAVLLAVCLLLGLCACGGGTTGETQGDNAAAGETGAAEETFLAGFGRADITPTEPVPIGSNGVLVMSTGYFAYMYANATAITGSDGNTVIFVVGDMSWCPGDMLQRIRDGITEQTGISESNIILSGTHTHAGVNTAEREVPSTSRYIEQYIAAMVEAGVKAYEDRVPAKLYTGAVTTERMNFVRRYFMDDGSLVADNTYGTGTKIVEHETDPDPELQVLRLTREGKKDIVIAQFQAHPHLEGMFGETYTASPQVPGYVRDYVEKDKGCLFMYWNGAAGNMNSHSRIESDMRTTDRMEYSRILADYVLAAYDTMAEVQPGPVKTTTVTVEADVNHMYDDYVDAAIQVQEFFAKNQNPKAAADFAKTLGLNSYYHANRVVSNSKLGKTEPIIINACSVGDVGFAILPVELFAISGMTIKSDSPFSRTFIVGYSSPSYGGYIPSADAWENGGYECDNSRFVPGTAEKLVEAYLGMLKDLHTN